MNSVFSSAGAAAAAGPSYEGWAEPPAYTGRPTLYLPEVPGDKPVAVPEGTQVTLRVYGAPERFELAETVSGGMFVCAVVGYYDPKSRTATWANAGFPPALAHRADGSFEEFPAEGPPLAVLGGVQYAQQTTDIAQGGLYFFSDGVTDVRDENRQTIGLDGVRTLFGRHATLAPEARLRAIVTDLRRQKLADDTTIVLLEDR